MNNIKNLHRISEIYQNHPSIPIITRELKTKNSAYLQGLIDSSFSCVLFEIFKKTGKDILVIMNDREEAAYLYNESQGVLGDERCDLLVSGFKRAIVYGQAEPESALLRSESLRQIANTKRDSKLIITYPESLMESTVSYEQIEANTLTLNKNENISIDFLTELLITYKFELVDFVFEPGQYAVRGSIVDIFSYSNTRPYRIDFFGDVVDSLRTFDLETQISNSHINQIKIIPDLSLKSSGETRYPITHLLKDDTILVFDDVRFTLERIKHLDQIAYEKKNTIDEDIYNIIVNRSELEKELKRFKTIYRSRSDDEKAVIKFNTSVQPNFSKNFDLLQTTVSEFTQKDYEVIIVSEQQKQLDRITNILDQIDPNTTFTPLLGNIHGGFVDHDVRICVFTDHQIFDRYQRYRVKLGFTRKESLTIEELTDLHPGDYVVHMDHGIGQFGGLENIEVNGKRQEVVKLVYRDKDTLYVNIHALHKISKYKGKDATPPKIHKLGSSVWQNTKSNAKNKIKDIARELISLYAERIKQTGHAFPGDSYLSTQLEASFIYEDTPDQESATKAVKADMGNMAPMDRLICGDVGFGKTEIAIRAAFKAV
ncbi:MAG: CarD family transcriptional regulator, partial [Salinivirgaceae bacterium]|nr:CarD family transcriptional regulator [Salinivirgaceae bacterium]